MRVIIGTRPIRRDYAIERSGAKTANVVDIRISALAGGGCSAGPDVSGGVRPVMRHRAAKPSRVPGYCRRRFWWWRRVATTEGSCHVHPHASAASSPARWHAHRPSTLGYWIGGALMAAAVVGAAIWAAFALLGDTRHRPGAAGPSIRDFPKTLPPTPVAARLPSAPVWDIRWPAAHSIGRQMRRRGYQLAARSQGLVVTGACRPSREGEREWAKTWDATLARQLVRARN